MVLNRLRPQSATQLQSGWIPLVDKQTTCIPSQPQKIPAPMPNSERPLVIFPGGGIYFWWQAGAVKALQEMYDLDKASLAGASAGAVCAVLAGCNVDMDRALDIADRLALEKDVWGRPRGLMGIWGGMIYERQSIDDFASKHDLIQACLASVHIPFFLDGKVLTGHRGMPCVDGSLTFVLRNKAWHFKEDDQQPALMVHYQEDPVLMAHKWGFLQTISQAGFRKMFEQGYAHMRQSHTSGALEGYSRLLDLPLA